MLKNIHKLSDESKGGVKKKLLKPASEHGQIIFSPPPDEFFKQLKEPATIGTAHQPYFFNPGISLKFIFLAGLPYTKKEAIFIDSDRAKIEARIPARKWPEIVSLVDTNVILDDYPTPEKERQDIFFKALQTHLQEKRTDEREYILTNFLRFKEIFIRNSQHKLLKEVLVQSFLEFYQIELDFSFLSELIQGREFQEFFLQIYRDNLRFKEIFNTALDEYRKEFRFRYKNYPFPKLEDDELPFWVIQDGQRIKPFKRDIDANDCAKIKIFPRAATLTIFLRLYKINSFIHGIGGANYEWVQDRIIERFFGKPPPAYAVLSGTFRIGDNKERDFPYFFYNPEEIKQRVSTFIKR